MAERINTKEALVKAVIEQFNRDIRNIPMDENELLKMALSHVPSEVLLACLPPEKWHLFNVIKYSCE